MKKKIFLLAGEASGDLLGALLVQTLKSSHPEFEFLGMGGTQMQTAGVHLIVHFETLSIVGIQEILRHLPKILRVRKTLKNALLTQKPDLLVLIDYPGFNLSMADWAHRQGIRTLYYVSPQLWAWNYRRIHRIRRCVDHMATLFPFEERLYQKENVPASFVGHPLMATVKTSSDPDTLRHHFRCDSNQPMIALLPGSRPQEIQLLLPALLAAKKRIQTQLPQAQFYLALANTIAKHQIEPYLQQDKDVHLVEGRTHDLISIADAVICCSGTATLEVALLQKPQVIVYKVRWLTYWIARGVIRIANIGLCNIVAGDNIAKELIQNDATPEAIATETLKLLQDHAYKDNIQLKLKKLRASFIEHEPTVSIEQLVVQAVSASEKH